MGYAEVLYKLMEDPYYETVAPCFLEEALNAAIDERGTFRDFEELDSYIKSNLI